LPILEEAYSITTNGSY